MVLPLTLVLGIALSAGAAWAGRKADRLDTCLQHTEGTEASALKRDGSASWGVDLISAFSERKAWNKYRKLQKAHRDVLSDLNPILVVGCNLTLGTHPLYTVRISKKTRKDATDLCKTLREKGIACIVHKR